MKTITQDLLTTLEEDLRLKSANISSVIVSFYYHHNRLKVKGQRKEYIQPKW
jgi:hypothetical protein